MIRLRRLFVLCAAIFATMPTMVAFSTTAHSEGTPPDQAARFINDIGSRTIKILASQNIPQAERTAKVRAVLSDGLDMPRIGRFALGRFWNSASAAQRDEYLKLFREYVLNTYSRRLSAYSGETFKVTGAQPIAGTDAIVYTVINRPNDQPLNTGWRVRAENGTFKVVDVVVEGVSMVLTQRQEFASVIQNKGLNGLLDSLRAQNQGAQNR